jgi:hypothetical protein
MLCPHPRERRPVAAYALADATALLTVPEWPGHLRLGRELRALGQPGAARLMASMAEGPIGLLALDRVGVDPAAVESLRMAGLATDGDPVGFTRRGRDVWMAIRGLI